jgi:alginate O-acetyltransferase complex protein AlgJ
VAGRDGWWFLPAEIRHLATAAATAAPTSDSDPLPAILGFHQALAAKGIRLVILPVPEKSLIRADQLFAPADVAAAAGYAKASGRFTDALRKKGVDVMDVVPLLAAEAARSAAGGDPVYCRTDTHFTPHTTAVLARAIAAHLRETTPAVVRKSATGPVPGPERKLTIQGDLAPSGTREELAFQSVLKAAGATEPPAADPASPVLLLGDSHCLVFHAGGDMLAKDGGLADHLGVELGGMPEVMAVRGSGATAVRVNLYRKARKDPAYLATKKVVIWCFAAREFTQSDGWKIVPLP